ncbi:MAG: nucleotidyltransferase domain-containing protein [Blastocatellia bacterium]|nr:nucleotidyltransferase domain-containing protein [Blastocatellia bacterium]
MRNESFENLIYITKEILQTKYSSAEFVFLAGSIIRGEGTKYSDLDIVVIFENLPNAYRESFYFQDFPWMCQHFWGKSFFSIPSTLEGVRNCCEKVSLSRTAVHGLM